MAGFVFSNHDRAKEVSRGSAGLLLAANVFFFWPVFFHGKVFSSMETARVAAPWSRSSAPARPRNPLLADASSASLPTLLRLRRFPEGFFWNRFVASGIPGAINIVQGYLSPFAWLPAVLLPPSAVETGILFLKFNFGFLFFYAFARSQGLSATASACGAAAWGWSSGLSVWWLWMQSSTALAMPLLLYTVARMRTIGRSSRALLLAAGVSALLLTGGYPHMVLYAGAAALLFAGFDRPSSGGASRPRGRRLLGGAALAAGLLLPAILVSARLLRESGAPESRRGFSATFHLPISQLALYADPLARGDTLADDYRPFGSSREDNYMETAAGVGPVALLLALAGAAGRKRRLYAFAATLALGAFLLVYVPGPIRRAAESAPLVSAGLLERAKILIVLAIAVASAVGAEAVEQAVRSRAARGALRSILPAAVALPLLIVAARFYPAVAPQEAVFRKTPGLEALQTRQSREGGRFAGTGWTIYPDLSEAYGLEDIRGHLFFESGYRRLLQAADPGVGCRTGSLLIFDRTDLRIGAPVLDLLDARTIAAPPGTRLPLPIVYSGPDLALYARPTALPRFFLAGSAAAGGVDEVRRASRMQLETTAFVESGTLSSLRGLAPAGTPADGRIFLESLRAESFRLRVETKAAAVLGSSQKLFPPYWRARVDGDRVKPIRFDGLFFGVPISPGRHVVEGRFRLPAFERVVSLLSAAVLAAVAVAALRRPRAEIP
jgi:hypothetical protein